MNSRFFVILFLFLFQQSPEVYGKDFHITGKVTDIYGNPVSGATVEMSSETRNFSAVTGSGGNYSLNIFGIYSGISGLLETGKAYPNPFAYSVHIPFIVNTKGDLRFSVYSLSGSKISESIFPHVDAGSYNLTWDGCSNNTPVPQGLYVYAITFRGETRSGRLVKLSGALRAYSGTTLEQVVKEPAVYSPGSPVRIKVVTKVSEKQFFPVCLTDITIGKDTIIDFELSRFQQMPFKTMDGHIARLTESGYIKMILKGINLGSSPPGTFPGEIAYAISEDYYEKWINRIGEAGFNSIRVYTLHPPVFYEKLANYNYRHRNNPIHLFQGIWLGENENPNDASENDLFMREDEFIQEIHEVMDCIHGEKSINFRPGRAYGHYRSDLSEWAGGFVLGREISPEEVIYTDIHYPSNSSFYGDEFSISDGSASEIFAARMLDETVKYEQLKYSTHRPVSFSSWPTLDPLIHPTETETDEDKASMDFAKIRVKSGMAGLFATFHAYPYYPNYISDQPGYQMSTDNEGRNSYLGYLKDLKNHFSDIPLVIGEFGVPSSWGSAHWSFSNMEHGAYSEIQQGEKNIRLMKNILDAGCAGGFMFSWMDEWFKPTWIVQYLEAYGFKKDNITIPTRQLWHNITSPEQNFGLLSFEQVSILPYINYSGDVSDSPLNKISSTHENSFFHLDIELKQDLKTGDTVYIAYDTYSATTGESILPNGREVSNRSEFVLKILPGKDTAEYLVTQSYDMNGLTPRFNMSDPSVQKYRSTVSDGAPWILMKWTNDAVQKTVSNIGLLPVEQSSGFSPGNRCAVTWTGKRMRIRIPWTMLNFYDPSQMTIIDGAVTSDGGRSFAIIPGKSDGISVSVYVNGKVFNSTSRYLWDEWLVVPETIPREKKSLQVVEKGLSLIPNLFN